MTTLATTLEATTNTDTVNGSIATLITGIQSQVMEALTGVTLPTLNRTLLDAVFADLHSDINRVGAAVVTGTPAQAVHNQPVVAADANSEAVIDAAVHGLGAELTQALAELGAAIKAQQDARPYLAAAGAIAARLTDLDAHNAVVVAPQPVVVAEPDHPVIELP